MTAEDYVRRVELTLRDLPWSTRRELVSELRGHLSELPSGTDLEARLGSPEKYAADLRAAAGLEPRHGAIAFVRARRPRNVILAVVTLIVIGFAIGGVAWIQTYQPIALAGTAPAGPHVPAAFQKGRPFRIGVDVRNTGRYTVRVLGVPYSSGPFSGLPVSAQLMMSRDTGGIMKPLPSCNPRHATPATCGGFFVQPRGSYEPFHPFDLKPGRARNLLVRGSYGNCHAFPSSLSAINLSDFPVRFSFLWKTATVHIHLPKEREIIPPNRGCKGALARHKSRRLTAPERVVYGARTIKIGAEVVCLRRGARAGALVPRRGQSVVGIADGRIGGATIRLTTRPDGSVVASCS